MVERSFQTVMCKVPFHISEVQSINQSICFKSGNNHVIEVFRGNLKYRNLYCRPIENLSPLLDHVSMNFFIDLEVHKCTLNFHWSLELRGTHMQKRNCQIFQETTRTFSSFKVCVKYYHFCEVLCASHNLWGRFFSIAFESLWPAKKPYYIILHHTTRGHFSNESKRSNFFKALLKAPYNGH